MVLALAAVAWWVWSNRVEHINRLLVSSGPVRGTVADLALTTDGISIRGFELRDGKTNALVARVPELSVKGGMRDFTGRQARLISLNDVEVMISKPFLDQLLEGEGGGGSSEGFRLPGGWRVARAELRNARLRYEERDGTTAEIVANYHADDISTTAAGALNVGEQELTITGGALTQGERPVTLAGLHARGHVHEGIIELDELLIEKPALAMTPEFFATLMPDAAKNPKKPGAAPSAATGRAMPPIRGVRIGRIECNDALLSATGFKAGNAAGVELPDGRARVDYETTGLEWLPGKTFSPGAQWVRLDDVEIKPPAGEGRIACREMNLVMPAPENGRWSIGRLAVREPEIHWTPELRRLLLPERPNATAAGGGAAAGPEANWAALLQNVEIRDARITVADAGSLPFEVRTGATLNLRGLLIDANGVHSAEEQTLEVRGAVLGFRGRGPANAATPFLELPQGTLSLKPDAWNASKAVETLALTKPVLRLRDGNTPWFDAGVAGSKTEVAAAGPADAGGPLWQRLRFTHLAIEDGSIDIAAALGGRALDAQGKLAVMTDDARPGLHRVRFENFEARLPGLTLFPFPVARVSFVECAAPLPGVWNTHRIESLQVIGADIEAGSALMTFFEPSTAEEATDAGNLKSEIRNPKSGPDWIVGDFSIADSFVTLDHLVPGMDSVKFEVSLDAKDAPLSPEGLAADVAPQRVELANLQIPSPYGGPPVARLDSVFVNFSPAGLTAKRIDKVEIVSPTLFIGEPLFWYVDYYRRYASQRAPGPETQVAALDKIFALQAAAAAIANEPPAAQSGWNVKTLQVHSGKLVIAPKGVPLAGFRTPFPFSFTSEVDRGTLEADFEIPSDDYELPDLKLRFEGMRGSVQFNLPVKNRDNNVTEVFRVKRIRWKELHGEDAFLSVTYDLGGIYGKFGIAAYEGYVNGEFNIYNDTVYSWDGWVSGKNVQTRELARKLFPGYFFMEGKIGATLTTNGDGSEVYEADGKFENQTPGRISIEALNDLIRKLPESMSGVKEQLAQITLETLRDFEYDRATGKFRTYGREGAGTLRFTGPAGSRSFEINAYDHRWKTDPPQKALAAEKDALAP